MTEPHVGGTYDQLLAFARWAEDSGLASFARSDHYYSTREPTPDATDAFATMAGLARDTERIRLCVLVAPVTFRHPAVVAKSAATIDQMSGGRLDLGVGTGWMEEEHTALGIPFPERSERFARLQETLEYLAAAFTGEPAGFQGAYYSLDATVRPAPNGVRIVVGGSGARLTPTLAGHYADEYNLFLAPADEIAPKVRVMRKAADGRRVAVSVMGPALVGRTDAEYSSRLEQAAAARGIPAEELEQRYRAAGIPVGGPERAGESVAALEQAGVDKWYLQWMDLDDLDSLAMTMEVVRGG
ncbi:LLM class F420-dependent oxidoreductase [soil metagenome]